MNGRGRESAAATHFLIQYRITLRAFARACTRSEARSSPLEVDGAARLPSLCSGLAGRTKCVRPYTKRMSYCRRIPHMLSLRGYPKCLIDLRFRAI